MSDTMGCPIHIWSNCQECGCALTTENRWGGDPGSAYCQTCWDSKDKEPFAPMCKTCNAPLVQDPNDLWRIGCRRETCSKPDTMRLSRATT